jgi:hypothetical protein
MHVIRLQYYCKCTWNEESRPRALFGSMRSEKQIVQVCKWEKWISTGWKKSWVWVGNECINFSQSTQLWNNFCRDLWWYFHISIIFSTIFFSAFIRLVTTLYKCRERRVLSTFWTNEVQIAKILFDVDNFLNFCIHIVYTFWKRE